MRWVNGVEAACRRWVYWHFGKTIEYIVQNAEVRVNGAIELRRGHRVAPPDVVAVGETEYRVCSSPD